MKHKKVSYFLQIAECSLDDMVLNPRWFMEFDSIEQLKRLCNDRRPGDRIIKKTVTLEEVTA